MNHRERPSTSDDRDDDARRRSRSLGAARGAAAPRQRRAGEDDAAIQRAIDVTRRFALARSVANAEPPGLDVDQDYDRVFAALADLAVDGYCRWCVVDIVRPESRRLLLRRSAAPSDEPDLAERVLELEAAIDLAVTTGRQQRYPADVTTGLPWCLVAPLTVHDAVVATVAFVRDPLTPGFGPMESTAADEMAWGAAATLERLDLLRRANSATGAANRVAEHLRALIEASLSLQGVAHRDVSTEIVARARSLFDADVAVLIEDGSPVRVTRCDRDPDHPVAIETAPLEGDREMAWFEGGWLVTTVRDPLGHARGRLAVNLRDDVAHDEDLEIITLFAQTAATTLTAAELSAAIRASEARWRVLVDSAPIGLVEVDAEERVRWWNRAAAAIFAWPSPTEIKGTPAIPADVHAHLRALWSDVIAGDLPGGRELHDVEVAERRRDLVVSARLLVTSDESPPTLLTLVDDVTDRRQMREELRHAHTMEIRGLVAGTAVHDFNNLLTIISGYAELLADELVDGPTREAAAAIVATSARASALTSQLQTIGRTQRPDPVTLDPATVVASNAEVIERILGRPITFTWSAPTEPVHVRVDADQFEQVLLNLVINARDAMADGGELRIDVRRVHGSDLDDAHRVDRQGDVVLITITDTGVGMDEETRRRCFEPLFTTKGPFAGTGLGLAAARRLMAESGGSIECRSQRGVGSTFEVALPVSESTGDTPVPVDGGVANPRRAATILVVEDDEALRRLIVQVLRRNGHRVLEAGSGEEALEVLDDAIELVVSDVVMGAVSGVDLARQIGAMPAAPAVLLTSATADASVLDDLGLATADFIAKPFRPSQLVDRVYALLARHGTGSRQG